MSHASSTGPFFLTNFTGLFHELQKNETWVILKLSWVFTTREKWSINSPSVILLIAEKCSEAIIYVIVVFTTQKIVLVLYRFLPLELFLCKFSGRGVLVLKNFAEAYLLMTVL